jgi:hypothetical protein
VAKECSPSQGPDVDHVCWLVPEPQQAVAVLQEVGLGFERGMFYERAGTQHYNVWLRPPQYLEFLHIADRAMAGLGDVGPDVLLAEERGQGLFAWAVHVPNLEAVSLRLGIQIDDYTLEQPDGTFRGWRTVSGPSHLPFFIDYPNNGNRSERLRTFYERCGHRSLPGGFGRLFIAGDEAEMNDWVGPNAMNMEFSRGGGGLYAVEIQTAAGTVRLP